MRKKRRRQIFAVARLHRYMTNREIAKIFKNVAAAYSIIDQKKYYFQLLAYQKAADVIENSPSEISDLIKENTLEKLPGVGASIKSHLEELIKTGKVKHFDTILKEVSPAIFPLLDIPSFGPKKAQKLVSAFKLQNPNTVIEDIEDLARKGKIAPLESFGEKSEQDILRAIAEFKQGKTKSDRMVLPFAQEIADDLLLYLRKNKDVLKALPLGSLRRRLSTIGDIDFAVATENPKEVIEYFTKYPRAKRVIEKGESGASLLLSSGKQVDLLTQPPKSFGSLLQHFTGSKNHNIAIREYAIKKGLSLSEKGIKKEMANGKWQMANFESEEAFYHALGMDWIMPEIREDTGEVERALNHNLPKLVELSDIKTDFHLHSSFPIEPSHDMGQSTMEAMVDKAKSLGYTYLAFSEHNPSISNHTSQQIYSILSKRKEKIEHINSNKNSIRVISLLETDILVNGKLAIDDKSLTLLDGTIVSIHSSFGMDKKTMTKRVLEGLSHPKAKILAHPTGRLLNERAGYDLDWKEIFAFCKKNNKALEINSWPERLDLPDIIVREAVKDGVKMVIDTDSHEVSQMDLMQYGVSVARRGWAEKKDILNTLLYEEFMNWLNK